ncbi:tpr repeat-containing protein [Leptolyngbya sp. Heron Island J]|uniref:hypothetical protein n=1 Tax=Leptolyngbya sp. Heron Island J TaxID=1385935 RepID=UPI0003B9F2F9|nr:hypothetical protein [Leptolyngbya sp. Heron Island J]ESA34046.1 tpr repeat-containing protein [Leptolyngbya sp. Heron Island J]
MDSSAYHCWTLGILHLHLSQIDLAFEQYRIALAIFEQENDYLNAGRLLNHLSELYRLRGDVTAQKHSCTAAIHTFWQLKSEALAIPALSNVAMAYYHQNYPRLALKLLKQVTESCQHMGDLLNEAITLFYMANVYASCKQYLFAIACHKASIEILQTSLSLTDCKKAKYFEVLNFFHIARVYEITHHSYRAKQIYLKAFKLFEKINSSEDKNLLLALQKSLLAQLETY